MQICSEHWEMVKQSVRENDMWHKVAQSGQEIGERFDKFQKGEITESETFDPLLTASLMIYREAIKCGGPYLLGHNEKGEEYCPICEVMMNLGGQKDEEGNVWSSEDLEKEWTSGPVNAVRLMAEEKDLL